MRKRDYNNKNRKGKDIKPKQNKDTLASKSNDPAWYSVDPVILRDAASFPFAHPSGHPVKLGRTDADTSFTIPGVMAMDLMPTIGYTTDASAPVNIAATQSYAFIRHGNSGAVNYDAGDIMLYYLAMSDVYSYIEYLKRLYGTAQLYAQRNRFMPYSLLCAMKIDPASLEYNLANFRLGINMLINKAASFAVPNTMSLFRRRAFLYQNLYTEGDSVKDQLYCFTPAAFQVYDWTNSTLKTIEFTPSAVSAYLNPLDTPSTATLFDINMLLQFGNRMIDLIISNEDLGTMNGDILKVYGDNIIKLSHLDENYVTVPVKDFMVLEQFHNANIIPVTDFESFDIVSEYDDTEGVEGVSILVSTPSTSIQVITQSGKAGDATTGYYIKTTGNMNEVINAANIFASMNNKLLTTDLPEVTPEIVMELSRLVPVYHSFKDLNKNGEYYLSSGTEIPVGITIYEKPATMTSRGNSVKFGPASFKADTLKSLDASTAIDTSSVLALPLSKSLLPSQLCSSFKYAPLRVLFDMNTVISAVAVNDSASVKVPAPVGVEGNVCNYTVITPEQVTKLHSVAMLNEFATPHVAILK